MNLSTLHWRPRALGAQPALRAWLNGRGSLTARLQARCPGFRVRLLRQGRARPYPDECALIGLRPGARAITREVLLYCGSQPMVYAHTVLAPRGLRGPWRMVAGLGRRPLGAALFSDPRLRRRPLRFRRLSAQDGLYKDAVGVDNQERAFTSAATPWARRSLFVRRRAALLVTEVFLPGMETMR